MKNNKKAILYTSASLNGAWLLITIDIALWLHKENGFNKISISCISNYNPLNFFSLILRLKNISSYLTKSKIKKISKLTKSPKSLIASNSELASFAVGKLDHANLMIGDLKIEFVRIRLNKKKIHLSSISIIYQVISDYLNFFKVKALKRKAYLNYKVSNIYAGLNILSEALRSDYKSYGSIFHSRLGILNALYKLGIEKGYSLVGTNLNGSNAFFIKKDLIKKSGLLELKPIECFNINSFNELRSKSGSLLERNVKIEDDIIKKMSFVEV